jgi:hypothetical protein
MVKLFLSHSSKDKEFVRKLGGDLKELGFDVWFDEWDIKVGDCIVQKMEEGITDSNYLIIVLTPESVRSGWVEREWRAIFWEEVNQKRVKVLPILLKKCEIPPLISTKKYADFRESYDVGFASLIQALKPKSNSLSTNNQRHTYQQKISSILKKVQSKAVPLSECFTELFLVAKELENKKLIEYCRKELEGWSDSNGLKNLVSDLNYRQIPCFYSLYKLNMSYIGFRNISNAFFEMESNPDKFKSTNSFQVQPISELESYETNDNENKITYWTQKLGSVVEKAKNPEATVYFYASGSAYAHLLEKIRTELTKQLFSLLDEV